MIKYVFFILFSLIFYFQKGTCQNLIKAEQLYNLDPSDPIDKMILAQSHKLDTLIAFSQIWLSDQVATEFDPSFGVILNKKFILNLAREDNLDDIENVFFLIIAHEKMHAFQYMRLQIIGRNFNVLSTEEMQILECQADMCAGYFFLFPHIKEFSSIITKALLYTFRKGPESPKNNTMPDFGEADSNLAVSSARKNKQGIDLFFKIGEKEGVFGTHPNPVYRKEAFEIGLDAFNLAAMSQAIPADLNNTIRPAEWEFLNGRYKMLLFTLGILPSDNTQPGNFFEIWSYRTACKILHFENMASKNIIFKIEKNKWDTSMDNSFLYFQIEVTNKNPDSVFVDMDIPIKLVSRNNPEDPLRSAIATAWHSLLFLAPNETRLLNDSTIWAPGTDSTMPSVYYPGQEGSFYRVVAFRPHNPNIYIPQIPAKSKNLAFMSEVELRKLSGLLQTITRESKTYSLNYFKDGAGLIWKGEADIIYNFYKGDIHFLLHVPIDQNEKPYLSAIIGDYKSLANAKSEFSNIEQELSNGISRYSLDNSHSHEGNFKYALILENGGIKIGSLGITEGNSKFQLELQIYIP